MFARFQKLTILGLLSMLASATLHAEVELIFHDAFSAEKNVSLSGPSVVKIGDSIDFVLASLKSEQSANSGAIVIRDSTGSIYKELFLSGQESISTTISEPDFYTARLYILNPRPELSNVVHFAVTTPLAGNISEDTNLTASESPYQLMESIQIRQGSELVIPKGTVIFGNQNFIQPFGTLTISGDDSNPVVLRQVVLKPGNTQSEGPYYQFDLDNLIMLGGSLHSPPGGGARYGSITVKDSIFLNLSDYTYVWYPTSKVSFIGNIFWGSRELTFGVRSVDVTIQNNLFKNYSNIIYKGMLQNWANYGSSTITVENNSFLDTGELTLGVRSDGQYDAPRNYWGTVEKSIIEDMIYDGNDDFAIPQIIDFEPFLKEPHPDTPTLQECQDRLKDVPRVILDMTSEELCQPPRIL